MPDTQAPPPLPPFLVCRDPCLSKKWLRSAAELLSAQSCDSCDSRRTAASTSTMKRLSHDSLPRAIIHIMRADFTAGPRVSRKRSWEALRAGIAPWRLAAHHTHTVSYCDGKAGNNAPTSQSCTRAASLVTVLIIAARSVHDTPPPQVSKAQGEEEGSLFFCGGAIEAGAANPLDINFDEVPACRPIASHATPPAPIPQHPTPNTQHPTPNTQHPTPNTQHPSPKTQDPKPNSQHSTLNTE